MKQVWRIGTRSSALALWQAEHIAEALKKVCPGCETQLIHHETKGDRILNKSLAAIGSKAYLQKS